MCRWDALVSDLEGVVLSNDYPAKTRVLATTTPRQASVVVPSALAVAVHLTRLVALMAQAVPTSFRFASVSHWHRQAKRTRKRLDEPKVMKVVDVLVCKLDDF